MPNLLDTFNRFFLRNISLLYTMNRYSEIEHIQGYLKDVSSLIPLFPVELQYLVSNIVNNINFLDIYREISSTPVLGTFEKCTKIMEKIK